MADCYVIDSTGALVATGQPSSECTGYVLLSGSEVAEMAFLKTLFDWPTPEVASGWLLAAFGFVVVMNVAGYVTGAVVKVVSTDRD